ncbi:MAG: shikimate dehydrogenase family protein, partial [Microbacteriaceae bacterium]
VSCPPELRQELTVPERRQAVDVDPFRLAVIGSPIAHSKSPALHAAAYRVLGLAWEYGTIEVTAGQAGTLLDSLDATWRGLSATMPVKRELPPLLAISDPLVRLTGVANTVLFDRRSGTRVLRGFNTDVFGITAALAESGMDRVDRVQILGGGATAASAMVAASQLAAATVVISVRNPSRAAGLLDLARMLGLEATVAELGVEVAGQRPDLVISTLPNGVQAARALPAGKLAADSVFFDVAYDPWPTPSAALWRDAGARVVSGLEMLVHQALAQVRIFVGGDPARRLDREELVLDAMKASVGLPVTS